MVNAALWLKRLPTSTFTQSICLAARQYLADSINAFCMEYTHLDLDKRWIHCSLLLSKRDEVIVTTTYSIQISIFLVNSDSISNECKQFTVPAFCFYIFPSCLVTKADNQPKRLCKEECEHLKQKVCYKEYLERNKTLLLKVKF